MLNVFGLKFSGLNKEFILTDSNEIKFIVTVNSEFIVDAHSDAKFKKIICDNIATFDGQIPYFLAKKITRAKIEKISGSDLIYDIINLSRMNKRKVFLLGDTESSNKIAVERSINEFQSDCYGYSPKYEPYPFSESSNQTILDEIRKISPYYLFVAFGAKKQEFWVNQNLEELESIGVKFVVGCGGSISFLSKEVNRAPLIIQQIGMEGVYRFIQEPKLFRLKRIIKSLLVFRYLRK